jgi:hypothetical protein
MNWKDYKVQVDALLENEGSALIGGRIKGFKENSGNYMLEGYWLSLDSAGNWKVFRKDGLDPNRKKKEDYNTRKEHILDKTKFVTLASGKVTGFGVGKWETLSLEFRGNQIKAYIGDKMVADLTDDTYATGNVHLGTLDKGAADFFTASKNYCMAEFDNFQVLK